TVDVLEIYMHQFWHTVFVDLNTQSYSFMLDDQRFEVGVDLLRDALQITPKDHDNPFVEPLLHDEIVSFIKKLGYPRSLDQVSKMETVRVSRKKRTETSIEETGQFKELVDTVSSNETETNEEDYHLNERQIGLVIGRGVNMEIDEGTLDQSIMKLKGVKNVSSTAQFLLDMKKVRKASKDDYII
nr:hypothetical protein [Tanacetum cinerariifolium]